VAPSSSPDGLILTNWHVVDMAAHRDQLDLWEAGAARQGNELRFELDETQILILSTEGVSQPQPVFVAETVAEHHALDFAVLQIVGDAYGLPLDPSSLDLPFVPIGDSALVRQGDPVHVFGYPAIGGGTLQYTTGVVSGFGFQDGIDGPAWLTTDASVSGGSSGGAAVNVAGQLIGVPTQGAQLDCRPGDTNGDGVITAEDVGCVPMGGSIGQLRPINLAKPMLEKAGWVPRVQETPPTPPSSTPQPTATQAPTSTPPPTPTPAPTAVPQVAVQGPATTVEESLTDPIADVSTYRGNDASTGEMPGPDPQGPIGELWRVDTGQVIWSSPAVVAGFLYIGTAMAESNSDSGMVLALDAATCEERWRFKAGPVVSSPTVHEGRVYVTSYDGYVYGLNASDG
jgi:hypothetical protein